MAVNVGAKTVLLVALVTVLLTYAAFQGKSSNGDTVPLQGRKGLPNPPPTPVLGEDAVTETEPEDVTVETVEGDAFTPTTVDSEEASEESSEEVSADVSEEAVVEGTEEVTSADESWSSEVNTEEVQSEENVDFSAEAQEDSEEVPLEGKPVREMEEALAPEVSSDTSNNSTIIENPTKKNIPEPEYSDTSYVLQDFARDNYEGRQNERTIQNCIREDGCGTVEP